MCRLVSPFGSREELLQLLPERIDWALIGRLAQGTGLLPALSPALQERGIADLAPPEASHAFASFDAAYAARMEGAALQIESIARELRAISVEPLWLKGAAMIVSGSRYAARRWMSDVDFWVPADQLTRTLDALRASGWRERAEWSIAEEHHAPALYHVDHPLAVEVHFELAPRSSAFLLPRERVLARSSRVHWRGSDFRVPHLADQALHLAAQSWPRLAPPGFLHKLVSPRRVGEFVQVARDLGPHVAATELLSACERAGHLELAREFLALASGLFLLPGDFVHEGALESVALKMGMPRLYSLYCGYRQFASRPRDYLSSPWTMGGKVGKYLWWSMTGRRTYL